jgi:hypothetical protein
MTGDIGGLQRQLREFAAERNWEQYLSLGFKRDRPWELAAELRSLGAANDATGPVETHYGSKYTVDGVLRGGLVRTVWIVDSPGGAVRFVTAYPRRSPT